MPKQLCFRGLKPTVPTLRTPSVARRIAERIVAEVNLDEFYWEADSLPDRIADVTEEIVAHGNPKTVMDRLRRKMPHGWDAIVEHCRAIAGDIAREEVEKAVEEYRQHYRA